MVNLSDIKQAFQLWLIQTNNRNNTRKVSRARKEQLGYWFGNVRWKRKDTANSRSSGMYHHYLGYAGHGWAKRFVSFTGDAVLLWKAYDDWDQGYPPTESLDHGDEICVFDASSVDYQGLDEGFVAFFLRGTEKDGRAVEWYLATAGKEEV
jgi:hypothetical protein